MPNRKTLGWAGFVAAVAWLYFDYQVKNGRGNIDHAIYAGWATILLTVAHIAA